MPFSLLRHTNALVYGKVKGIMAVAEESHGFPNVTDRDNGLGFGFKWNMVWMNDTLSYIQMDPKARRDHYNKIVHILDFALKENYVLSISHDEVVHGKTSILGRHRRLAESRQPACLLWLHVGESRQEATVHGPKDCPVERVEP